MTNYDIAALHAQGRVFLLVLDSVGAGALPDAVQYADEGAFTLRSVYETGILRLETLKRLGIGAIDGLSFLGNGNTPLASTARLAPRSAGKDTTCGHWEIAGVVSQRPMPTFPDGFPPAVIDPFCAQIGRGILCNRPYSGTQVIRDYGQAHLQSGKPIVYTSADSVFQIAAHVRVTPLETLYQYCRIAREILRGDYAVGRVIARPFDGDAPDFFRTPDRKDFSAPPPKKTVMDALCENGYEVFGVGKIGDIFAGRGLSHSFAVHGNDACMQQTLELQKRDFHGLCFVNLVDFDMLYGHRNDARGYAQALNAFDTWLAAFLQGMRRDDILFITADHGCDPGLLRSTDHTREYVPLLCCGRQVKPVRLGTRLGFCDIGATIADIFGVPLETPGVSFAGDILYLETERCR